MNEKSGSYISKSGLKYRGWTDKAISMFLPTYDKELPNPHYSKSYPMKLYLVTRVDDIENTYEYKRFTEKIRAVYLEQHALYLQKRVDY